MEAACPGLTVGRTARSWLQYQLCRNRPCSRSKKEQELSRPDQLWRLPVTGDNGVEAVIEQENPDKIPGYFPTP